MNYPFLNSLCYKGAEVRGAAVNAARQLGITIKMRMGLALCLAFLLLIAGQPASAVDGTFRGKVIDPPENQLVIRGWIFVQGRNRMLRRVEVAHATIVFGEEIPASQRRKCDSECLSAGQEVRVTAQQDSVGEWRAKKVEILRLPTQVAKIPQKVSSLSIFTPEFPLKQLTNRGDSASHFIRKKCNFQVYEYAAL